MSGYYGQSETQPLYEPHAIPDRETMNQDNTENIKSICRKYMNYHVIAHMKDGSKQEGIIEDINNQGVVMLVPEDIDADDRQFYGYRPRRFRRFRRFLFPFILFGFPFIYPYPYY